MSHCFQSDGVPNMDLMFILPDAICVAMTKTGPLQHITPIQVNLIDFAYVTDADTTAFSQYGH